MASHTHKQEVSKRLKTGRPKSAPTKIITFRVRLEHEQAVRKAVAKEVKRLKGNA